MNPVEALQKDWKMVVGGIFEVFWAGARSNWWME
jgi:hypothetical protein